MVRVVGKKVGSWFFLFHFSNDAVTSAEVTRPHLRNGTVAHDMAGGTDLGQATAFV